MLNPSFGQDGRGVVGDAGWEWPVAVEHGSGGVRVWGRSYDLLGGSTSHGWRFNATGDAVFTVDLEAGLEVVDAVSGGGDGSVASDGWSWTLSERAWLALDTAGVAGLMSAVVVDAWDVDDAVYSVEFSFIGPVQTPTSIAHSGGWLAVAGHGLDSCCAHTERPVLAVLNAATGSYRPGFGAAGRVALDMAAWALEDSVRHEASGVFYDVQFQVLPSGDTAVVACGGFSAVCGSSLATAATMSKVAMPPMRKYGYDEGLAAGSIAAGGTLGILIPPSVILIIFGIMTESDIGLLFIAGILPGLLGVILYLVAVLVTVTLKPEKGPRGDRFGWPQRLQALWGVSGVLALFGLVIGGIYGGIFTPTEAAGIGASGAFFIALIRQRLSWQSLFETLVESARTTAMIFVILIGAEIFSNYVNIAGLPELLSGWVVSFDLSAIAVIMLIMLVYVVLGTVLESLSMIMLTVPVFYPLVLGLDLGGYSEALMDPELALIWFGIIVVVITEISLITPPVGLNVFVLKSMLDDVKLSTIFRGVTPFWIVDIVRLMTLILLPGLVLWLPNLMAG